MKQGKILYFIPITFSANVRILEQTDFARPYRSIHFPFHTYKSISSIPRSQDVG